MRDADEDEVTWLSLAVLAGLGLLSVWLHRLKARSGFSREWHAAIQRDGMRNTYEGQALNWGKVQADFAAYRERTRA